MSNLVDESVPAVRIKFKGPNMNQIRLDIFRKFSIVVLFPFSLPIHECRGYVSLVQSPELSLMGCLLGRIIRGPNLIQTGCVLFFCD